jgi:hypothetical protein
MGEAGYLRRLEHSGMVLILLRRRFLAELWAICEPRRDVIEVILLAGDHAADGLRIAALRVSRCGETERWPSWPAVVLPLKPFPARAAHTDSLMASGSDGR